MYYREMAFGSPSHRGILVREEDMARHIEIARRDKKELYFSYYRFPPEIIEHFRVYKTIKSYRGSYSLATIVLDIDGGTEPLDKALEVLKSLGVIERRVWHSGTGYHIEFANIFHFEDGPDLPSIVKATLTHYFPMADNIYDGARLLRAPYTINTKNGRYKVPLVYPAMGDGSDIADTSLITYDDHTLFFVPTPSIVTPDLSLRVRKETKPLILESTEGTSDDPTRFVTCMQRLYSRGAVPGRRHTDMLRLISNWQRNGVPDEGIVMMLQSWLGAGSDISLYEIKRQVKAIRDKGYRYSCADPVMEEHCDERCVFYKSRSYGSDVIPTEDAEKRLVEYARRDIRTVQLNIGKAMGSGELVLSPGEVAVIWADTGVGKSAFAQNMVIPTRHLKVLYISLEMGVELVYRRFVQILHRMSKDAVMAHYRAKENTLSEGLEHIKILQTPPTLQQIRRVIADQTPNVVVIDVIDLIHTPHIFDDQTKLTTIINALKDIAIQQHCIIIGIHHISKSAAIDIDGRPRALTMHSGKGPSAIEQKADVVIGIEKQQVDPTGVSLSLLPPTPAEMAAMDGRLVTMLKGRDHAPYTARFVFDPDTFLFEPIT